MPDDVVTNIKIIQAALRTIEKKIDDGFDRIEGVLRDHEARLRYIENKALPDIRTKTTLTDYERRLRDIEIKMLPDIFQNITTLRERQGILAGFNIGVSAFFSTVGAIISRVLK